MHELPPLMKSEGYSGSCRLYLVCTRWTEEFPKIDTEYSGGNRHVSPTSDVTTEVHSNSQFSKFQTGCILDTEAHPAGLNGHRLCSTVLLSPTAYSGMGGILDTLTRPSGSGDLLAGSIGSLRRERDDRCLSLRRSFSFAPIDPGSERSTFSSVSGLFDLAVGTMCESPRIGCHAHVMTTTVVRPQLEITIDFV